MESNDNLETLREKTQIELEALLQFDSPPETPNQLTGPNEIKHFEQSDDPDVNVTLCNSIFVHNREKFSSQIDSKIDFSIFHHESPILQWSLSDLNVQSSHVDDSVIETTQIVEPVEISNISIEDTNKSHYIAENFLEFNENEKSAKVNNCNSADNQKLQSINCYFECFKENSTLQDKRQEHDFEEIDNIFNKIDFDSISNLEESFNFHEKNDSNWTNRKCQSQVGLEPNFEKIDPNIISSCPAVIRNKNSFFNSSNHSPKHTDNSQIVTQNNGSNINLSKLQQNKDANPNTLNDYLNVNVIDNINFNYISNGTVTDQQECCTEFELQSRRPNNEDFLSDEYEASKSPNAEKSGLTSIPDSVRELHKIVKTNHSDFAFVYALCCQLCQERVPMECFVTLKMALLLSLASIGNNVDRPAIPIVAMGNDTYMINYLMSSIGKLGSRFLGPVEYKKSNNNNWIEADSIILARGGVYYVGDWSRLKIKRAESIFKNIECSTVMLEKSTDSFPLETAIWTHWRSFKYGSKDQRTFNTFLKIFGIPIFVSDDNHETLVDYTLEQTSVRAFESTVDHLSINEDDMRNFLVSISQNDVDLTPEAALLLKNYFVTTRSTRKDCLTKQSYVILKQFAESFAKLSLHKMVLQEDALAAIIMCEHSIVNIFGPIDNPPPHFGNFTFVGSIDEYLMQFKEWLISYLKEL